MTDENVDMEVDVHSLWRTIDIFNCVEPLKVEDNNILELLLSINNKRLIEALVTQCDPPKNNLHLFVRLLWNLWAAFGNKIRVNINNK